MRAPIGLPSPRSVSAPTSRISVVELLSLTVEVVDSSPAVVLASVPLPELLVVPVLELVLAAGSEVKGGVVVNADVSAGGDWQAGTTQSSRERGRSLGRMISSLP